ncbi:MAG: group II intron reverse transcriptase/maturase [Gammaproteobacteria bacterium]|nr:group II intron reverse transcriptase/maturase [Gammaproteobacteria bacterium]
MLEAILESENLHRAWQRVRQNKGAAGIDGISLEDYPTWARAHWLGVCRALEEGYYIPQPVRRVEIPKPGGGMRQLGIPCVNDRVIQQAIVQVLQPLIDPHFSSSSHGFRPNRSGHDAVRAIQGHISTGYTHAVDIDLSKFFDRVGHDRLMHQLGRFIADHRVLKLIGRFLRAGVVENGRTQSTLVGVPQGGPLSPLLANVMLDDLDKFLESRNLKFARYADDFVISVKSPSSGFRVKAQVERFLEKLKLPINEAKSSVCRMSQLSFLGFIYKGKRIVWSPKSLRDFKWRVRQLTGRSWGISWRRRYMELRRYIQGWMNYYGLSKYYRPLAGLDHWLRRRVRMCYLKQWRKPRTRIRNLRRLGVPLKWAIDIGMSSKGYYRLAKTKAVQMGLNNRYLSQQGLISIEACWVKFHYG